MTTRTIFSKITIDNANKISEIKYIESDTIPNGEDKFDKTLSGEALDTKINEMCNKPAVDTTAEVPVVPSSEVPLSEGSPSGVTPAEVTLPEDTTAKGTNGGSITTSKGSTKKKRRNRRKTAYRKKNSKQM